MSSAFDITIAAKNSSAQRRTSNQELGRKLLTHTWRDTVDSQQQILKLTLKSYLRKTVSSFSLTTDSLE